MSVSVTHVGVPRGDLLPVRGDLFVNKATDVRYVIDKVVTLARVKSFQVTAAVQLHQLGFSAIEYDIPIPAKLLEMDVL
jgi:hypothetical protein